MQKMLTKKYRHGDDCVTRMKPFRMKTTTQSRDDLLYLFNNGMYYLYQIVEELGDNEFTCVEMNTEEKTFSRVMTLNFGRVGVFKNHGHTTITKTVKGSEVAGKVIAIRGLLFTVPKNVLQET